MEEGKQDQLTDDKLEMQVRLAQQQINTRKYTQMSVDIVFKLKPDQIKKFGDQQGILEKYNPDIIYAN